MSRACPPLPPEWDLVLNEQERRDVAAWLAHRPPRKPVPYRAHELDLDDPRCSCRGCRAIPGIDRFHDHYFPGRTPDVEGPCD